MFDPKDRSALALLIAAIVNSFFMLQALVYMLLEKLTADPTNALLGAQSVLINTGAIVLMLFGLRYKNKEVLGIAVAVALLGTLKSFGYDLFKVHGVPLVLSVFSFGALATIASVGFSRWQQRNQAERLDV